MKTTRSPAEERLLDASLAQLFGRQAPVARAANRRQRWFAAALLLLGLGVVAATALWEGGRHGPAQRPAQEPTPHPLPPPVTAQDVAELGALPATTGNLVARMIDPGELTALARLTKLRRLQVIAMPTGGRAPSGEAWHSARTAADVLRPLAALPMLEELELPFHLQLRPEQLQPLRMLPNLRSLSLTTAAPADAELGTALRALPALREIRLRGSLVETALFTELAGHPLRSLSLSACPGLDDDAFAAIARLRTLRRLEITCQNSEGTAATANGSAPLRTLDAAAFAAFAALPELRELLLDESAFDDRMFARLPVGLERLDLGQRPMGSLVAEALRRLGSLRDLTFGCGLDPAPAADLLGALRLRRLDYRGRDVSPELLRAIGAQPDLEELSLRVRSPSIDLSPLVAAPRLSTIEIRAWQNGAFGGVREGPGIDQLRALRACAPLRRLVLHDSDLIASEVQELFDGKVAVELVEYL